MYELVEDNPGTRTDYMYARDMLAVELEELIELKQVETDQLRFLVNDVRQNKLSIESLRLLRATFEQEEL